MEDLETMLAAMTEASGCSREDLLGKRRNEMLCFARFFIWDKLREIGHSYNEIGAAFGKSHSAVIHGIRKARIAAGNSTYPEQNALMEDFSKKIEELGNGAM